MPRKVISPLRLVAFFAVLIAALAAVYGWRTLRQDDGGLRWSNGVPVIELSGPIEARTASRVARALEQAESSGQAAVLVWIDSSGGMLHSATEIQAAFSSSPLEIHGLVADCRGSAILVLAAIDRIYVTPRSLIGSATPIPAVHAEDEAGGSIARKLQSMLAASIEGVAPTADRAEILTAMVDLDREYPHNGRIIKQRGETLAFTGEQAITFGLAERKFVDLDEATRFLRK